MTPIMGQLPPSRTMVNQAPFNSVGVDFVGQIKIREGSEVVKGNLVLVTCLTTRACHLEVTGGGSAADFIKAWKRFILKVGIHPNYVMSDSAAAFKSSKSAVERLAERFNSRHPGEAEFKWELCHPRAPHRRGAIECFVKTVKRGIEMMAKENEVQSREEWETTVCEITHLLNTRYLVHPNQNHAVLPITANHILHPYQKHAENNDVLTLLKESREQTQAFWKEWMENVTIELFKYPKWDKETKNLTVGSKVLVIGQGYGNAAVDRKKWKVGTIVKCIKSKDSVVRKVIVEYENGKQEKQIAQKLVLIKEKDLDDSND